MNIFIPYMGKSNRIGSTRNFPVPRVGELVTFRIDTDDELVSGTVAGVKYDYHTSTVWIFLK